VLTCVYLGLCRLPVCLQDTNALVFRALLAALGLSAEQDYDMNRCSVTHTDRYMLLNRLLLSLPARCCISDTDNPSSAAC
jgi:hypothetical protein